MLSKTKRLAVVNQVSKTGSCLARLTASQWGSRIFSITTDYLSNLAAGPLDEFHLVHVMHDSVMHDSVMPDSSLLLCQIPDSNFHVMPDSVMPLSVIPLSTFLL